MSLEPTSTEPLLANLPDEEPPLLPQLSPAEEVVHDYLSQGLSLRGHPFTPLRPSLDRQRVLPIAALDGKKAERRYRIAGLVLVRQRPSTAKGTTFLTIEDETGTANLIVWAHVWEKYRRIGRQGRAVIASGLLQRQDTVTHLIVDRLQDLTDQLPTLGQLSRDFH